MIKKILLVVVIALAGFLAYAATRPAEFRYARSATFAAPPAAVFAQVNDFHKWQEWSPWAKLDPNSKATFEGPAEGVGASFGWAGNSQVGEGKMSILESQPSELIRMKLDFLKPMPASNTADFTFKPKGQGTVMTWTMYGRNSFAAKAFSCVVDCDKLIGGKFEEGLANLKKVVEAKPAS